MVSLSSGSTKPTQVVGLLGVGTMNAAIAEGLATASALPQDCELPIYLSPRGTAKVAALEELLGKKVKVCASNLEVIQKADMVILGVRPPQVDELLAEEGVRDAIRKKLVVNLVSTLKNAQLVQKLLFDAEDPTTDEQKLRVIKAVPLPAVAFHQGCTVLAPPTDAETASVRQLFGQLGEVFEVEETQLPAFQALTGMMGPFYQHCEVLKKWLERSDVEESQAQRYVYAFHKTVLADAAHHSFRALMEAQTKGGINEQCMGIMEGNGPVAEEALDTVHKRIKTA